MVLFAFAGESKRQRMVLSTIPAHESMTWQLAHKHRRYIGTKYRIYGSIYILHVFVHGLLCATLEYKMPRPQIIHRCGNGRCRDLAFPVPLRQSSE